MYKIAIILIIGLFSLNKSFASEKSQIQYGNTKIYLITEYGKYEIGDVKWSTYLTRYGKSYITRKAKFNKDYEDMISVNNIDLSKLHKIGLTEINNSQYVSNNASGIVVYPNPVTTNFKFIYKNYSENTSAKLLLVNENGLETKLWDGMFSTGENNLELDVQSFPNGYYNLVLLIDDTALYQPVVIIK